MPRSICKSETAKKRGTRKVKMAGEEFKSLSEAGLPPSEESEEGRVEREVDVYSEPPEIDTTRAEERPSYARRLGTLCFCIPFLIAVAIVVIALVVFASEHSRCSSRTVLVRLSSLNHSSFEGELGRIYEDCLADPAKE